MIEDNQKKTVSSDLGKEKDAERVLRCKRNADKPPQLKTKLSWPQSMPSTMMKAKRTEMPAREPITLHARV